VNANILRDYSLEGSDTNKAFNAMGALSSIAFAFNTSILCEMQIWLTLDRCSLIMSYAHVIFKIINKMKLKKWSLNLINCF